MRGAATWGHVRLYVPIMCEVMRPKEDVMTDESVIEWASGWLRDDTTEDPTFRQRFLDGLASELRVRRMALVSANADRDRFALEVRALALAQETNL